MKNLKIRRIMSSALDYFICFYIFYIPAELLEKKINGINQNVVIVISILLFFLICATFVFKDTLYKNRSLGKKIFKLAIYTEKNNEVPDKIVLLKRSLISLFTGGINIFTILLSGKSIGDYIYKTKVENYNIKTTEKE